jgi:AcrR family transcriptional regulator
MQEQNRRTKIKNKAARLFRKKGYKATSMQDIAEEMGIKAASLYNHISSKQEILSELLLNIAETFTGGMNDISKSGLGELDKLEELISLHVDLTFRYGDSIALITGEWVHLEEPALTQYLQMRNSYEKDFRDILKDCQKNKMIEPTIDLDVALFSILSTLHWLYNWYNKNKSTNKTELKRQLKKILLQGLLLP